MFWATFWKRALRAQSPSLHSRSFFGWLGIGRGLGALAAVVRRVELGELVAEFCKIGREFVQRARVVLNLLVRLPIFVVLFVSVFQHAVLLLNVPGLLGELAIQLRVGFLELPVALHSVVVGLIVHTGADVRLVYVRRACIIRAHHVRHVPVERGSRRQPEMRRQSPQAAILERRGLGSIAQHALAQKRIFFFQNLGREASSPPVGILHRVV